MDITVTNDQGIVPITVMQLKGKLDGSNYSDLIGQAEKLYQNGVRNLLLDLSGLSYMSSAGIVALHTIAMLFRGERRVDQEEGWSAYHAVARDRDSGPQAHVKLLGLNDQIHKVLDTVGIITFFEYYNDLHQAVASFH